MGGVILENLSGKKLSILVSTLMLCQLICFLIGGLIAPTPSSVENVLATKCVDRGNNPSKWFAVRGGDRCNPIQLTVNHQNNQPINFADQVVFVFQIPSPRDNVILDYSRWQQNLIAVLMFDIAYHPSMDQKPNILVTMDVRLGYKDDGDENWTLHSSAIVERRLDCSNEHKKIGYYYNCSIVPLFELGSLHRDYYLLNIRLPVNEEKQINTDLGHLEDLWMVAINQNGGFTKVWMFLKCTFLPFIIGIMIWFWRRVHMLNRSPVLLEYMLLFLGGSLTFLNTPFELLTLFFDIPFITLLQDIRQGVFYAALLSFWLVFAGEHLMIQDPTPHHLRMYSKHLSAVVAGCFSLLVFDVCEKGAQIKNPFYSIWITELGTNLALAFIISAGISAMIYFVFLCYMIWQVFGNISMKKSSLPSMSKVRRLHYEGLIYRFRFLMLATLTCAAMTVIGFILGHVSEGRWKWDENLQIEYTSAFFTGVYGMWNIYIFALIVLYSPSHKHWPSEADLHSTAGDEMELSNLSTDNNDISLMTTFAKKVAGD